MLWNLPAIPSLFIRKVTFSQAERWAPKWPMFNLRKIYFKERFLYIKHIGYSVKGKITNVRLTKCVFYCIISNTKCSLKT
jgi:hypothetical protein